MQRKLNFIASPHTSHQIMCAVSVLKIRRPNCRLMTMTIIRNFRGKIVKHDVAAVAVGAPGDVVIEYFDMAAVVVDIEVVAVVGSCCKN